MYPDLKGKTALVTGAGKKTGIGYAIARKLADSGANVLLADMVNQNDDNQPLAAGNLAEMAALAEYLARRFDVKAAFIAVDVADDASVKQMADEIKSRFENLQILCNNAGTVLGVPSAIHTYDDDAWQKTLDVNLNGVFRVSKAVIPLMMDTGGSVINIASRAAKVPPLFNGAYAVAKAGVLMLTKVMARELAGNGIRVNAVCPGVITTDFTRWRFDLEAQILDSTSTEREAEMVKTIPMGRLGSAEEVANLAAFLASDQSSYTTGQAVNVTGGQLMEL
ncbi:short-chain dehydrogenase [Alkalispirochaeta odontotermitis]|nr:short-chain dehydrogenase [Alkalispirochaeta odontotermitis]CAB1077553.1 Oxidoreductase, short-chain dehydrogenase/reductase family [Olavius algarvensis Delta 1 endosymbiont]